jgi:hypothetical protein
MGGETKERRKYEGGGGRKIKERDQTNLINHLTKHPTTKTVIILAISSHHNNSFIMKLALR